MGNQDSKITYLKGPPQFINHPCFQNCPIVQYDNIKYIKLEKSIQSDKQCIQWKQKIKITEKFKKQSCFQPIHVQFQKQNLCGPGGILTMLFQYFPYLLRQQIINRKSLKNPFQQNELWYLLFTILTIQKQFQFLKIKVGDIRPETIFINEQGCVKISHQYSWPGEQINYNKTFINQTITFLAPQQIIEISQNRMSSQYNPNVSQCFSIGLTLIQAGLLQNVSERIYNLKRNKFQSQQFIKILAAWNKSSYSPFLKQIILSLVEMDHTKRKTASYIYNQLLPYEKSIKNLQPFYLQMQKAQTANNVEYQLPQLVKSQLVPQYQHMSQKVNQINPQIQQKIINPPNHSSLVFTYQTNPLPMIPNPRNTYQNTQFRSTSQTILTNGVNINYNDNKLNQDLMSRVDQQLKMSKRMFP